MALNAWLSVQSERCPGATQLMEKLIFKVGRWRMLVLTTVKLLCGNVYGVHSLPRPCVLSNPQSGPVQETFMMQMKRSRFSKGMQSVTQLGRWTHSQVISFGGIPFIHHYKFSQLERDWEPFSLPPPALHFLLCFAVQRHSGICLRF